MPIDSWSQISILHTHLSLHAEFSIYALFLSLLFTVRVAEAQSPATTAAVTEYVKAEMQRQHIPGLSLLVLRSGKIVRAEGFGLSNVELQSAGEAGDRVPVGIGGGNSSRPPQS